ncbi:MAG: NAD(P)/FAD-dependent oxidoreductase [Lutisporaceae bacterium]|jgi:glycine/D-amino acid oxidase-like deaminating enzyme
MVFKKDVCIIGGGVIGLATAYYLLKAGKSVAVLERAEIGSGASSSCDDMILLQSKKPGIALTLAMESLEMYRDLPRELGMDIGFLSLGGMIIIEDDKQLKIMENFVKQQISYGLDVEIVDRKTLFKKQPHVARYMIASTYSKSDSQVNPLLLMRAFLHNGLRMGMDVFRHTPVIDIDRIGDRWMLKGEKGINIECDSIVIAAGAWSAEIGKMLDIDIPIKPVKGQIAVTEQIAPIGETNCWTAAYIASKHDPYIMPDRSEYDKEIGLGFAFSRTSEGNYLIGSTRENAGFDKSTNFKAISRILEQTRKYFPIMNQVNIIRTIAGFRPGTKDGSPIIGAVDGFPGLFIAAGHEGDGIALSPITGKIMAEMVQGVGDHKRLDELNLRRFSAAQ